MIANVFSRPMRRFYFVWSPVVDLRHAFRLVQSQDKKIKPHSIRFLRVKI